MNDKNKHQKNMDSVSAKSKGQSISFARASVASAPSVEVAQIPN